MSGNRGTGWGPRPVRTEPAIAAPPLKPNPINELGHDDSTSLHRPGGTKQPRRPPKEGSEKDGLAGHTLDKHMREEGDIAAKLRAAKRAGFITRWKVGTFHMAICSPLFPHGHCHHRCAAGGVPRAASASIIAHPPTLRLVQASNSLHHPHASLTGLPSHPAPLRTLLGSFNDDSLMPMPPPSRNHLPDIRAIVLGGAGHHRLKANVKSRIHLCKNDLE